MVYDTTGNLACQYYYGTSALCTSCTGGTTAGDGCDKTRRFGTDGIYSGHAWCRCK